MPVSYLPAELAKQQKLSSLRFWCFSRASLSAKFAGVLGTFLPSFTQSLNITASKQSRLEHTQAVVWTEIIILDNHISIINMIFMGGKWSPRQNWTSAVFQ